MSCRTQSVVEGRSTSPGSVSTKGSRATAILRLASAGTVVRCVAAISVNEISGQDAKFLRRAYPAAEQHSPLRHGAAPLVAPHKLGSVGNDSDPEQIPKAD